MGVGAAELSKIISARAERGLYLSTARLFHKRFPRLLALFFIFYKVNEIVPPRSFVNRFRSFFRDFLIFAAFAALFLRFLRFQTKSYPQPIDCG